MWVSKKDWLAEREKDRQAHLEAIRAITDVVQQQLQAVAQMVSHAQAYTDFLYTSGVPESRTVRDEDEFEAEMERKRVEAVMRFHGEES
jgi:hypothetical protein